MKSNKTFIYLLGIVIITVLAASVILPGIAVVQGLVSGFNAGYSNAQDLKKSDREVMMEIVMTPSVDKLISTTDSIEFDDGQRHPAVVTRAAIFTDSDTVPMWTQIVPGLAYLLVIVILIALIVFFIKFIVNVSKGRIFIDANARYLRYISLCLILIAVLEIISGLISESTLSDIDLRLAGYEISAVWTFPWSDLIIGLCCMLISLAWARGIAIKKEQELTI